MYSNCLFLSLNKYLPSAHYMVVEGLLCQHWLWFTHWSSNCKLTPSRACPHRAYKFVEEIYKNKTKASKRHDHKLCCDENKWGVETSDNHGEMALDNLSWVDINWEIKDENEATTQRIEERIDQKEEIVYARALRLGAGWRNQRKMSVFEGWWREERAAWRESVEVAEVRSRETL